MVSNQAAWLSSKTAKSLDVKPADYTPPGENEIVIKNAAIAMNPVDGILQLAGGMIFTWIKHPFILGSDSAGEVVEVGKGVTRFKVGDRVVGNAVGMDPKVAKSSEGAFQLYTVLRTSLTSPIPSSMSYEDACVFPLCVSTAACGLFMKDALALSYPSLSPKPTGKTVLIWGGSTSVGSSAIQLAIAAGYEVITTASPKNFNYVKRLGAVEAYDYRSPTVVQDIIKAFQNRESAGAMSIGQGSASPCFAIVGAIKGNKFVTKISVDMPKEFPTSAIGWLPIGLSMVRSRVSEAIRCKINGIGTNFVFGTDLMRNEVGPAVWQDFLPKALAQGKFVPAPEPLVVGKGLEFVQEAINLNLKGMSVKKAVVTL
ncbi:zinc-binding dehydrogenase-1 [Coleophoma cylindrospora]|uniref:Zinc-binding dehydrogenase-1 n=1 Tax=Coleophoma cylindrospora TaxID=1849047 RepID=A0A3D8RT09_9HELO|nr:zinc-binding dehydrogenase-1 [Coleophoma cylindrospora]